MAVRPDDAGQDSLRLVVDLTRCRGHGICMLLCTERIELDEWGFPVVDSADIEASPVLHRARRAAAACPTGALRLESIDR